MALKEIDEHANAYEVEELPHLADFQRIWLTIPQQDRDAIEREINSRLDSLVNSPDPNWGSITNTSIEGGRVNPVSGIRGDWGGTPFHAIWEACGRNDELAGKFYGNVWKKVIIGRAEQWIGIRSDPTFPNRGISLEGKTYFLPS